MVEGTEIKGAEVKVAEVDGTEVKGLRRLRSRGQSQGAKVEVKGPSWTGLRSMGGG